MNFRILLYSILGFALVVMSVFAWSAYSYYEAIHSDDPIPPSLTVTLGTSTIIRGDIAYELTKDEYYKLDNNDIIETGNESHATIIWPDKSITRLGPKTRIVIEKMYASTGYDAIQISYSMERGKVWNTVIRSLIGDSYFEIHLPRESVVAGVRGTIFEINLDNKYIHAVTHNTLLTHATKGSFEILPGELVDSENIWVKKGKEWLDTTWNEWNTSADLLYESLRKLELQTRLEKMAEGIGKISISNMTRTILQQVSGFEELKITEFLEQKMTIDMSNFSTSSLISYYQKLGNFGDAPSREILRNSLLGSDIPSIANIRESLQMHAFWQSIDTGKLSETTEKYLQAKGINTTEFKTRFTEGAKNDITYLLQTLSGGLSTLFPF